jgi:epoxyqueuosine reductase
VDLYAEIKELTDRNMVDYLGVADLSPARQTVLEQGGSLAAGYHRAVTMGIVLQNAIVDLLPECAQNRAVATSYLHEYQTVNQRLDLVCSQVAGLLQREGQRALPVPASERYDDQRIAAVFSHKLAAHLAGLGWIGKSCLLINPQHGPRVRWTTVLTDAPLTPTGQPLKPHCGKCTACVDICPIKAFTGEPFREDQPREARYNARSCDQLHKSPDQFGLPALCGLCVYVCPYGRK